MRPTVTDSAEISATADIFAAFDQLLAASVRVCSRCHLPRWDRTGGEVECECDLTDVDECDCCDAAGPTTRRDGVRYCARCYVEAVEHDRASDAAAAAADMNNAADDDDGDDRGERDYAEGY